MILKSVFAAVQNLWPTGQRGAAPRQRGHGQRRLLEQHKHVLGLQDINVDMQAGEITVVMGLSGSGKSTLIRHLNRLIEPTAGEILVDGDRRDGAVGAELREVRQTKMSMVFQKVRIVTASHSSAKRGDGAEGARL